MHVAEISIPRVIISGIKGKIGKTLITVSILYGLTKLGCRVQPFKIGPDFIDPMYHRYVCGEYSRNLDVVMMDIEKVFERFYKYTQGKDFAIIEGVFGLYDSIDGISEIGSTAQIAKLLKTPIILIIDTERVNRGVKAIIKGFLDFDKDVEISGIVFTNVASEKHGKKLCKIVEDLNIPVIGVIPRCHEIEEVMKYRHLGLIPTIEEIENLNLINVIENYVLKYINLDLVIEICKKAKPIKIILNGSEVERKYNINIGILFGKPFSFTYPELLEYCHIYANKVYYIDPMKDTELPKDIHVLIIPGGFPEVYANELSKNKSLMKSIVQFHENNGVIYAECGGLMYLTNSITTFERETFEMCGIFNAETVMYRKPIGHGYVIAKVITKNPILPENYVVRGHEFHHSKIILKDNDVKFVYKLYRGFGVNGEYDGLLRRRTLAQYLHIHPSTYNYILKLIKYSISQNDQ